MIRIYIIADGLLILLLLIVCVSCVQAVIFTQRNEKLLKSEATIQSQDLENESQNDVQKEPKYGPPGYYGVLMVGILTYVFFLWPHIKSINNRGRISFIDLIILIGLISVVYETLKLGIKGLSKAPFWKNVTKNEFVQMIVNLLIASSFIIVIGLTLARIMAIFHKSFLLSNDLKNMNNIECKIKLLNTKVPTFEVVYFNDKYIFAKITDSAHITYTEVLKFDDLLDMTSCK